MIAAGLYLRTLREEFKHLSRAELAAAVGTHESQIVRIEAGQQDTRGSLLLAIISALGGKAEHLHMLMANPNATAEDGRNLALSIIEHQNMLAASIANEHDPYIAAANELARINKLRTLDERIDAFSELPTYFQKEIWKLVKNTINQTTEN